MTANPKPLSNPSLHSTRIQLDETIRTQSALLLNQALADLSDLSSQTKQAHWNVKGPSFYSLHLLFDSLAGTVEGHLDTIAERITTLGGIAQGTIRQAAAASSLPEFPQNFEGLSCVASLIERFGTAANSVRTAIDAAANLGDADTADLFTAVSRDLDKSLWFLEAHLRK
jgi:starvation-inducible DNA-binding protein